MQCAELKAASSDLCICIYFDWFVRNEERKCDIRNVIKTNESIGFGRQQKTQTYLASKRKKRLRIF